MKLSSRKELLREATEELNKIKKSITRSSIKESNRIKEFSLTGELATDLAINTTAIRDMYMAKFMRKSDIRDIIVKVETAIEEIGEKYHGKIGYYDGIVISFDGEADSSMIEKLFIEIKRAVEPMINTKLFELNVSAYVYKSSGILGTKIGRGKIKKWIMGQNAGRDTSIGNGDSYEETFQKSIDNMISKFSEHERDYIEKKIDNLCASYFKDKSVLVKDTDWVKEIIKKLPSYLEYVYKHGTD
jgi:hypothetical protein